MRLMCVVGGRPNLVKLYPIWEALDKRSRKEAVIVHTGQHYDYELSEIFFQDLKIPKPHEYLDTGSGTHGLQTGKMLAKMDEVLAKHEPDLVMVFGDMNSTTAGALAAAKMCIPVAHVQAGCRCFDKRVPEELNRRVVDHVSDILFPEAIHDALNLVIEGIPHDKIHMVGNVVIDALMSAIPMARKKRTARKMGLATDGYAIMTVHRAENTDDMSKLTRIMNGLISISEFTRVLFPIHPRTKKVLSMSNMLDKIAREDQVILTEPLGYLDFIDVLENARFVITDSGGIQEEAVALKKPCITLRNTCDLYDSLDFNNFLVGTDYKKIVSTAKRLASDDAVYKEISTKPSPYPYWDGCASKRIVKILKEKITKDELKVGTSDFRKGGPYYFKLFNTDKLYAKGKRIGRYNKKGLMVLAVYDKDGIPRFIFDEDIPRNGKILLRGSKEGLRRVGN